MKKIVTGDVSIKDNFQALLFIGLFLIPFFVVFIIGIIVGFINNEKLIKFSYLIWLAFICVKTLVSCVGYLHKHGIAALDLRTIFIALIGFIVVVVMQLLFLNLGILLAGFIRRMVLKKKIIAKTQN